MSYLPPFIDEFTGEAGLVTDCVPASGLMGVNKARRGKYPATAAEREALQNAMGTQNLGAGAAQLVAGLKSRYGMTAESGNSWAAVVDALKSPHQGVAMLGKYSALPLVIRNHGRQPGFTGLHAMYVQSLDPAAETVTYGDPLATSFGTAKISDFQGYFAGLPQYVLFEEESMTTVVQTKYLSPRHLSIAAGAKVDGYSPTQLKPVKTAVWPNASGLDASAEAVISQTFTDAGPTGTFYLAANGFYAGLYLPVGQVTAQAIPAPLTQANVDAAVSTAVAPLQQEIISLEAEEAAKVALLTQLKVKFKAIHDNLLGVVASINDVLNS